MSSFFIILLTFFLILNCALLILLVLVQLPKKDAGAGLAFGSGAADALFGAGSGNALTKITKWATIIFLLLSLFLGYLWDSAKATKQTGSFTTQMSQPQPHPTMNPAPAATPAPSSTAGTAPQMATNRPLLAPVITTNTVTGTNSAK